MRAVLAALCLALPASAAAPRTARTHRAPAFFRALATHMDRLEGAPPEAVVPYLAMASLATAPEAARRSPEAEAARFLVRALADPAERGRLVEALRLRRERGARALAARLDAAEEPSRLDELRQLAADLASAPGEASVEGSLKRFFSGVPSAAESPVALSPEDFSALSGRRFGAGTWPVVAAIPADSEMQTEVARSPLTNPERERVIVELFQQAGASRDEVKLQDAGLGRHNIYVVKKGRTDRVIVVGGHHDKVSEGAGTIDNWTGATMAVNLFQAIRDIATEATYVFIAFAREEEGLLGSREYLRRLSAPEKRRIDAMVNLDTLAVDGTFSWKNGGTRSLLDVIKKAAGEEKLDLAELEINGGDSDSSSFLREKIPAAMVFGASNDVIWDFRGRRIIHSDQDTIARFSLPHYKNAYLLVLATLQRLDKLPIRPQPAA